VEVRLAQFRVAEQIPNGERAAFVEVDEEAERPVRVSRGHETADGLGDAAGRRRERRVAGRGQGVGGEIAGLAGLGVADEALVRRALQEEVPVAVVLDGPHGAASPPSRRSARNSR
jgi:hypothetical protein